MIIRLLADLTVLSCLVALGVFAKAFAEGGFAIAGGEIPWSVLALLVTQLFTAGLTILVKTQFNARLNDIHVTFNSKMDKLLETVAAKSKAEGVLEEKTRAASESMARSAGIAEGKGLTP